jgi:uncharacterized protein YndB with AHSA1/START domain
VARYNFITTWTFPQPIERVWEAINASEDYPRWWSNIRSYRCLTPDNPRGVGARGERVVRGLLPYPLRYTTNITRKVPPRELDYDAFGDLVGRGRFVLREISGNDKTPTGTEVVIYWEVETSGRWLNRLAPLLKWLFAWNHNYVMRRGERGLAAWLARDGA